MQTLTIIYACFLLENFWSRHSSVWLATKKILSYNLRTSIVESNLLLLNNSSLLYLLCPTPSLKFYENRTESLFSSIQLCLQKIKQRFWKEISLQYRRTETRMTPVYESFGVLASTSISQLYFKSINTYNWVLKTLRWMDRHKWKI